MWIPIRSGGELIVLLDDDELYLGENSWLELVRKIDVLRRTCRFCVDEHCKRLA